MKNGLLVATYKIRASLFRRSRKKPDCSAKSKIENTKADKNVPIPIPRSACALPITVVVVADAAEATVDGATDLTVDAIVDAKVDLIELDDVVEAMVDDMA